MPLSEFTIRHARITGKNYTLCDFDGLSLWVTKAESKLWLFRYYWEGHQQRMSFGAYLEVSLKQVREYRDEARKLFAQNINPCEHGTPAYQPTQRKEGPAGPVPKAAVIANCQ